jgi:hypothetical protein
MSAAAPYCNVTISLPGGAPVMPTGPQRLPPNPSFDQITNIVNNNFTILSTGNYVENKAKRVSQTVRIFDPGGSGAYIDVNQIISFTLVNQNTGQTVVWHR